MVRKDVSPVWKVSFVKKNPNGKCDHSTKNLKNIGSLDMISNVLKELKCNWSQIEPKKTSTSSSTLKILVFSFYHLNKKKNRI